jgi:hypothetical protein
MKFLSMFVDEVAIMDCQGWIDVHVYVLEGWKCIPILLTLEELLSCATTNNLIKVIVANVL